MKLASSLFLSCSLMQSLPLSLPSSPGTAIRHCDEHKGWLPPNLFNCTSTTFSKLKLLVCNICTNSDGITASFKDSSCIFMQESQVQRFNNPTNVRRFN